MNLYRLVVNDVPRLNVCGSLDPWYDDNTRVVEKRYSELGGSLTVNIKEGKGHYPLAPNDLQSVEDFMCDATGSQG